VRSSFASGGSTSRWYRTGQKFLKSATVDHARDGEVMIAYGMNGEQLPMLNGFPLRLVVPGWSGVYWVKMLNNIEVLSKPDTNYWTSTAYRVPDVPNHTVEPGDKAFGSSRPPAMYRDPSLRTFMMATSSRWEHRRLPAASPSAVIAASQVSMHRSMRARVGNPPSLVRTKASTVFGNGRRS
jgi:DMSO/TMAO reductase YedYZ molybdopterin-dependent catalytic subunit